MSVKVGVRVRPFNKRQTELGAKLCIQMQGCTTHITDENGSVKSFVYDYSFWSHDKFRVDENGVTLPIDNKYADQKRVYQEIGSDILINAWEGYNCCLFAYGQTGSGKSYSMIGYGANRGVIPIVCDEIFKKIESNTDKSKEFEVKVSMLQIYNQTIRDLLAVKGKKTELKICEHKKFGVYVQGLQKQGVSNYKQIQKKIEEGSNNRSIAATLMNESSSRSHTIVSITFIQKITVSLGQTSVKYSTIHLVDLAGSECVAKTGADSKDRLRETAKINQSLSTLGRVIEILAENCSRGQKLFVPYRDSKLTFILRNALGGNSRTAMICAISPADDNYEETMSTLRYASRAKKIQNKAIVNQSDVDKLIRMLREENQMLKKMLHDARYSKTGVNQEMISNFNQMNKNLVGFGLVGKEDEESLLQNLQDDSMYLAYDGSVSDGVDVANQSVLEISPATPINDNKPYITNVSEDPLLSFRIKYAASNLHIGNKQSNPRPDVILSALGIQPEHARIFEEEGKVWIITQDQTASNYTYINGANIRLGVKEEIVDKDRIIFGTGCVFMLMVKGGKPRNQSLKLEDIDYEFAINEIQISSGVTADSKLGASVIEEQELRKKIVSQIEKEYQNNKLQSEELMKKQIEEQQKLYRDRIREIQQKKNGEAQKLQKELQQKHRQAQRMEEEKQKIKRQIEQYSMKQKELEQKEQQQKKELDQTKNILESKLSQIKELQQKMSNLQALTLQKQTIVKEYIYKQEQIIKEELNNQTIMCHNQNRLRQIKLQRNKKYKNAKEVRELLIKKEKIELSKQLVQLVPKVQKFNLMGKQMGKRVQCGLSVQYKYISEAETLEVIKNNSYKSKLKIMIHVLNKQQNRSYYWTTDIFKNRFELALQVFQGYLQYTRTSVNPKFLDQLSDPYWDPVCFQVIGYSFLSMESVFYNLSFEGEINIIGHGQKMGTIHAKIYQTDSKGVDDISIDNPANECKPEDLKILNPRDYVDQTVHICIELSQISISNLTKYQSIKIEYQILQSNYKTIRYKTDELMAEFSPLYNYKKVHTIKELSENAILHYADKPLAFELHVIPKKVDQEQLTSRSSFSTIAKSSMRDVNGEDAEDPSKFIQNLEITEFIDVPTPNQKYESPTKKEVKVSTAATTSVASLKKSMTQKSVIYDNSQIVDKIEKEYTKAKKIEQKEKSNILTPPSNSPDMKKKKDKECAIY